MYGHADFNTNVGRYYGYTAQFPYTWADWQAPFRLTHPEAPPKDFVQWNPAYFNHYTDAFTSKIKVDGDDANEKVHLRQWYVPYLKEPLGITWVDVYTRPWLGLAPSNHIVKEYTFLLLDTDNNPVAGSPHDETGAPFLGDHGVCFPAGGSVC
jgi:hypothetical protein